MLDRTTILNALTAALEPRPEVYAMWTGGAAAFNRVDEWSDIDLQIDVEDEHIPQIVALVEQTIQQLSPITLRYEIPQPSWHGHWQAFYQLRDASPFLMLDLAIIRHSNPSKFLEREVHGNAQVLFDKAGVTNVPPINRETHHQTLVKRLETLRTTVPLFKVLVEKELHRGNAIEAISFYHNFSLRPLVEILRLRHVPFQYQFHTRYVHYDLPQEIVGRLEGLFFPTDAVDLTAKHEQAHAWMNELLAALTPEELAQGLE